MNKQLALPELQTPSTGEARGSIFFIGTATVLLRYGGFTILTDPNFIHRHEQVELGGGLKGTRQTDPAIDIHQLPPVDFVLLSHFHGDHFDQVAEAELAKDLPIITTPPAARELESRGFHATEAIDKWESITVTKGGSRLTITATLGRHGPPVVSFVLPDVMGSILEFQPANGQRPLRIYITGDTLVFDEIREIPRRFPGIDIALMHLGGTMILGLLLTMDAEQGVKMLEIIQPQVAIPIHYNDYDVFKSPLEDFVAAARAAGWQDRIRVLAHGETYTIQ